MDGVQGRRFWWGRWFLLHHERDRDQEAGVKGDWLKIYDAVDVKDGEQKVRE